MFPYNTNILLPPPSRESGGGDPARTTLIVDGRLKPTERVSDARRPARTATERIAAERVSDARGSTSKGR